MGGAGATLASLVAVGERLAIRPGDRVPLDGVVRDGTDAVDESPITGESMPAETTPGDAAYAGSITDAASLEVEATAPAAASTVGTSATPEPPAPRGVESPSPAAEH